MHNGHYFQGIAIVPIVKTIVPIVVKNNPPFSLTTMDTIECTIGTIFKTLLLYPFGKKQSCEILLILSKKISVFFSRN